MEDADRGLDLNWLLKKKPENMIDVDWSKKRKPKNMDEEDLEHLD